MNELLQEVRALGESARRGAIDKKLLLNMDDLTFLTGYSRNVIGRWINHGRLTTRGKRIKLRIVANLCDSPKSVRVRPSALTEFLKHFPDAERL